MIWLNIRQIEAPQRSARSTPKPMIRRVNTSITTMTQWLRRSIDSQRNKSTLHRLSFICPMKLSQDATLIDVERDFLELVHQFQFTGVSNQTQPTEMYVCGGGRLVLTICWRS